MGGEHTTGWAERWRGHTVRWAVAGALAVAAACAALLVVGRFGPGRGASSADCGEICGPGGPPGVMSSGPRSATATATDSSSNSASNQSSATATATTGPGSAPGQQSSRTPPATTAPKTAPSAASSSAPVSASALVQFKVTSHWSDGYRAAVTITDTGAEPLTDWHLTFHVTGAHLHQPTDTGETAMTGDVVTITPADWRRPVAAGAQATFGMEFDGALVAPSACALDGTPCAMQYVYAVPTP